MKNHTPPVEGDDEIVAEKKAIQQEIDRLTVATRNEALAARIVAYSLESMRPIAQIIGEALTWYTEKTDAQRHRHDYAPRPANPVTCWIDDPNYEKFRVGAANLQMSPEHFAYFCIVRYLSIDEKLEVVHLKTGPKTKVKRIRETEGNV